MSKPATQAQVANPNAPKVNGTSKAATTTAVTGAKDASKLVTNSTGATDPKASANAPKTTGKETTAPGAKATDKTTSATAAKPATTAKDSKSKDTKAPATKPVEVKPKLSANGFTDEEEKQLADLRKQVTDKRTVRVEKERIHDNMVSLVNTKKQIAKMQASMEATITSTNEKNTKLEQNLASLRVQTKREELIG